MLFDLVTTITRYNGDINSGKVRNFLYFRVMMDDQMFPKINKAEMNFPK